MLETDLTSYLLAQPSITAIVGQNIQPIPAPDDLTAYPCLTYQVASYTAGYSAAGSTGWAQKRIIFNAWAGTWLQAHTLLDAVRETLSGLQGVVGTTTVFFTEVATAEDYFGPDSRLYRASLHALVQYRE